MPKRNFGELYHAMQDDGKKLCIGLDIDPERLPRKVENPGNLYGAMLAFNRRIVKETADIAGAYKPNYSFYEAQGPAGLRCLVETVKVIRGCNPRIPVILDRKAGDIGNSLKQTLHFAFDVCDADAITVHPYMGKESMQLLLDREDKGIFVLCRTSNSGADEFQKDIVQASELATQMPLYQRVAHRVSTYWNAKGNCGLVTGATRPDDIRAVRSMVGDDMPILVPGVGSQGGDLGAAVRAAMNSHGKEFLLSVSGDILFGYEEETHKQKYKYDDWGDWCVPHNARGAALYFEQYIRVVTQIAPITS